MHSLSLLPVTLLLAIVQVVSATTATSAPTTRARSTYVTTSFYSLATTEIPHDEMSIGMGRNGTKGNYYWLACINEPFTTRGEYGGCGSDDLYTRCSGKTAFGIDGKGILCDVGCVTHRVYQDLDVTTFTPFVGCGRGTSTMNLLRTSTSSGAPTTTSNPNTATSAVQTGDGNSSGVVLDRSSLLSLMFALASLIVWI